MLKKKLKAVLLPRGRKLRRLRGGVSRGAYMAMDLHRQLQRYVGLDEREIAHVISNLIGKSRTLVDIGANDGYYTMAFLNSRADCVISCEPSDFCEQLIENAAANGHTASARFAVERRLIGNEAGNVTLAELLSDCPRPILNKVDVDGAELEVLRSAEGYRHLHEANWVVETHSPELEEACVRWFRDHQFRPRIIDNAWWRRFVPEQRPLSHNRWLVAEALA